MCIFTCLWHWCWKSCYYCKVEIPCQYFLNISRLQECIFLKVIKQPLCRGVNLYRFLKKRTYYWSSLIYNTSARHERHECDTSATQVRHECYTNNVSATRVKIFDFDNGTGKNIFSHLYIYYMASERLQGEEQFHTKNTFWKCLVSMPKCV